MKLTDQNLIALSPNSRTKILVTLPALIAPTKNYSTETFVSTRNLQAIPYTEIVIKN